MMQKVHFHWLLSAILCCVTFASQATINISGYTSTREYSGYPLFEVTSPFITFSSSDGSFVAVYIDDSLLATTHPSWDSYTLGIHMFCDGEPHKLKLAFTNVPTDYDICYFQVNPAQFIDGLFYTVNGTSASVSGSIRTIENAVILDEFEFNGVKYPVAEIADSVFYSRKNLQNVIIPNSITSIGKSTFCGCTSLPLISIPESVTSIGWYAFSGCTSLSSVNIPKAVTEIGIGVFNGCSFLSFTIPETVTSIGNSAFSYCLSLSSITIPESVTSIGGYAFANCFSLLSVKIPESVTSIGAGAFKECVSLTTLEFNAIECNECGSLDYPAFPSTITSLTFGDKVTNIPAYLLYNGNSIESLTIPNSVTEIGDYAFRNSDKLMSLTLGTGLRSIGEGAFSYYSSYDLKYHNIEIPKVFWLGDIPPNNCSAITARTSYTPNYEYSREEYNVGGLLLYPLISSKFEIDGTIYAPISLSERTCDVVDCMYSLQDGDIVIGDKVVNCDEEFTVRNINEYSFYKNRTIKSLTARNNGYINYNAFYECDALTTVNAYNDGFIGPKAFQLCYALTSLVASNGGDIMPFAFAYASLKFADISNKGSIWESAFYSSFASNFRGDEETILKVSNEGNIGKYAFANCVLKTIFVSNKGDLEDYAFEACSWSPQVHSGLMTATICNEGSIGLRAFYRCNTLNSVTLGDSITAIGDMAFSECSSLEHFSAGHNIKSIGSEAFSGCTNLKKYHSYSIEPPTCGSQAFDDINKWDCTLFVPAKGIYEYMAADQWKDFFNICVNENEAVLIENIQINVESLEGKIGESFQLLADILPDNATKKTIDWTSSDTSVVTVDATGLVTFIKEGYATITASAKDGSGVEATIGVVVTIKELELGDSNANGVVNIADAVNIANYAIGNEVEHFDETASDVNQDGIITLADASAVITLILNQPTPDSSMERVHAFTDNYDNNQDVLVIDNYTAKSGETTSVYVTLNNTIDYVALQADITVPEGLTLKEVNVGNRVASNHSLAIKRIDNRTMRIVLFDINNYAFDNNSDAILELIVNVDRITYDRIEINNILAADAQAHEYVLTSIGGQNTDMSGAEGTSINSIRIEPTANGIDIYNAENCEVSIYAVDGTIINRFVASSDFENRKVVSGVYVVSVGAKLEKVIVK